MSPSVDPSAEVKEQIETLISHIGALFKRLKVSEKERKLSGTEREWLLIEIRNSIRSAEWDLDDLEHTLTKIENCAEVYGLNTNVIAERRHFLQQSKSFIGEIRQHLGITDKGFVDPSARMTSNDSGYRYTRLNDSPTSSTQFFADTLQKQQKILNDQDRDLEKVGDSVHLLKNMSSRIGTELEEQSIMLDDLGGDMERTGMKLDGVMKKIAKVTNMNDDRRQWLAIFILSALLFFIILLFILL